MTRATQTVPGTEHQEIISVRGRFYTVCSVRIIEPSPDYPTPVVAVRITAGGDSCYSQMRIEEFCNWIRKLEGWEKLFLEVFPSLRQKEAVYTLAAEEREKQLLALRQLTGTNEEEGGMSPGKLLELARMMSNNGIQNPNPGTTRQPDNPIQP